MTDAASRGWALSLTDTQVGVTPLASPAAALTFPLSANSLNATYRQLRTGGIFPLSAASDDTDTQLTTAEHWHWLLANRSDGLDLQLAFGFLAANRGNLRFPVFQSRLTPDPDRPVGYLRLSNDEKLQLNSTLVRLLQQKFQIPSRWVGAGRTARGLNLDAILDALEQALQDSPLRAKMHLERQAAVGLAHLSWSPALSDLKAHLEDYRSSALVQRYAASNAPTQLSADAADTVPLAADIFAPLKADRKQLQVPKFFGQGHSLILSGAPATGKTDAVVNTLAQSLVQQHSVLVVGSRNSLKHVRSRVRKAGFEHVFLTLDPQAADRDERSRALLRAAWDRPVNADAGYLDSCRASLKTLSQDLDLYLNQIHEVGPNHVSAWQAYTAQIMTAAELEPEERVLAGRLAAASNFPYLSQDRSAAVKLGKELANLDANSVNGLGANPWSLVGETARSVDRTELKLALKALEQAITQAHPAVLEIMSATSELQAWPIFARWLDLLEIGYGRAPVELTEAERHAVTSSIETLQQSLRDLWDEATPLLEIAAPAYRSGKDLDLLMDARHAEASGGFTRNSRRKAVLAQLQPYLTGPVTPNKAADLLEDLNALRMRAEALGSQISANPVLGLKDFDALADDAREKFSNHADTVLSAIELSQYLPNRRSDLESLMPLARQGGHLGQQVRAISEAFADVLQSLQVSSPDLEAWSQGLPPLGRYLQVRKVWGASLSSEDSTLDDILAFRALTPQLRALGLDDLVGWVAEGKLSGMAIQGVLEHALSVAAVRERQRALVQQGFEPETHAAQVERLSLNCTETRREIVNQVIAAAGGFAQRADKQILRRFGARLRDKDFSIRQALRDDLEGVLTRTPIVGLTPLEVITHLPDFADETARFDAVVILDAAELPSGAVVKALAGATQAMFVAVLPATASFAKGRAHSVYEAAKSAGFPEYELTARYGQDLTSTPGHLAQLLRPGKLDTWPVAQVQAHPVSILEFPAVHRPLPLDLASENPGWSGLGADYMWFEKAGNLLMNLCLKNRGKSVTALTWTSELAAGIRWYLDEANRQGEINLMNLRVTHLGAATAAFSNADSTTPGLGGGYGDGEGQAPCDLLVCFLGSTAQPETIKTSLGRDLSLAWTQALLQTNGQVLFVVNRDLDQSELPALLQDVLNTPGTERDTAPVSAVRDYLAKLLGHAGLEVRTNLGPAPLRLDLAVRGDAGAPWLGLILDSPEQLQVRSAWDREVGIPQYLLEHCGFGAIEHVYLTQLMENTDEVTRRLVSIALDLAFPGDVTDGSVASDDRYTSPSRIAAAQNNRGDEPWEVPDEDAWDLPLPLREALARLQADKPTVAPAPTESSAETAPPPREPQPEPSAPTLPPAAQPSARIEDLPPAAQRKTSSALPVIADMPPDAFTHLNRRELTETRDAPTLGDQLGAQETDLFMELAQSSGPDTELGKISKPGLGAFAPLFAPEVPKDSSEKSAGVPTSAPPLKNPVPSPSAPAVSESTTPSFTAQIPADAGAKTVPQPFVPRGKPLQNQGSKEVLDDLQDPANAAAVADALSQVLYTEGPIGAPRLAKLVADAFGMQRLHSKRRQRILELLDSEVHQTVTKFGTFVWPVGTSSQEFTVFRTGSIYGQRALVDICDEEFNNALTWVIDTQQPLEDETSEAVARVLDLTPARTDIRQRMQAGLKSLEQAGRLRRQAGHLYLQ